MLKSGLRLSKGMEPQGLQDMFSLFDLEVFLYIR